MSAGSSSHRLGPVRHLRETEARLLRALLVKSGDVDDLQNRLARLRVRDMSDGGMGSLYIDSEANRPEERRFGRRVAELQFEDADGVAIIASLNIDRDGGLYELDLWKTDYSSVIQPNFNLPTA